MSASLTESPDGANDTLLTYVEPATYSDLEKGLNLTLTILGVVNLFLLMSGMGCAINWRQIKENLWPPIGIIIGMSGQFLILPALAYGFCVVFRLKPYEALGCLIICCSPGGALSNFFTYWVDGDIALSIVMTTFSSLLAFGTMPLNLWIYSSLLIGSRGDDVVIPYSTIFRGLCFVLGPAVLGMTIRHFNEKMANKVTRITSIAAYVLIIVTQSIFYYLYGKNLLGADALVYVGALILPVTGFILAYTVARMLRQSQKVSKTIGIETGSQNHPIAMSLIFLSYEDPAIRSQAVIFPSLYGIFMLLDISVAIGLYRLYLKRKASKTLKVDSTEIGKTADTKENLEKTAGTKEDIEKAAGTTLDIEKISTK